MLIDLTRTISEDIPQVSLETHRTISRDGWNAKMLHLYSHCGTHMDAPWHFECAEKFIDETPLETCTGMADIVRLPETQPSELLTVSHLGSLAESFRSGDHLLLNTNWSQRFGQPDYKSGLPRISEDLAQWCVQSGVKILGVEPASVADVANLEEVTRIHQILLGGGVTIVEGLVNLDQVPVDRCFFAALPLKIHKGDGAPCRAFASTTPLGFA
jgi:kynurenine formamidase